MTRINHKNFYRKINNFYETNEFHSFVFQQFMTQFQVIQKTRFIWNIQLSHTFSVLWSFFFWFRKLKNFIYYQKQLLSVEISQTWTYTRTYTFIYCPSRYQNKHKFFGIPCEVVQVIVHIKIWCVLLTYEF